MLSFLLLALLGLTCLLQFNSAIALTPSYNLDFISIDGVTLASSSFSSSSSSFTMPALTKFISGSVGSDFVICRAAVEAQECMIEGSSFTCMLTTSNCKDISIFAVEDGSSCSPEYEVNSIVDLTWSSSFDFGYENPNHILVADFDFFFDEAGNALSPWTSTPLNTDEFNWLSFQSTTTYDAEQQYVPDLTKYIFVSPVFDIIDAHEAFTICLVATSDVVCTVSDDGDFYKCQFYEDTTMTIIAVAANQFCSDDSAIKYEIDIPFAYSTNIHVVDLSFNEINGNEISSDSHSSIDSSYVPTFTMPSITKSIYVDIPNYFTIIDATLDGADCDIEQNTHSLWCTLLTADDHTIVIEADCLNAAACAISKLYTSTIKVQFAINDINKALLPYGENNENSNVIATYTFNFDTIGALVSNFAAVNLDDSEHWIQHTVTSSYDATQVSRHEIASETVNIWVEIDIVSVEDIPFFTLCSATFANELCTIEDNSIVRCQLNQDSYGEEFIITAVAVDAFCTDANAFVYETSIPMRNIKIIRDYRIVAKDRYDSALTVLNVEIATPIDVSFTIPSLSKSIYVITSSDYILCRANISHVEDSCVISDNDELTCHLRHSQQQTLYISSRLASNPDSTCDIGTYDTVIVIDISSDDFTMPFEMDNLLFAYFTLYFDEDDRVTGPFGDLTPDGESDKWLLMASTANIVPERFISSEVVSIWADVDISTAYSELELPYPMYDICTVTYADQECYFSSTTNIHCPDTRMLDGEFIVRAVAANAFCTDVEAKFYSFAIPLRYFPLSMLDYEFATEFYDMANEEPLAPLASGPSQEVSTQLDYYYGDSGIVIIPVGTERLEGYPLELTGFSSKYKMCRVTYDGQECQNVNTFGTWSCIIGSEPNNGYLEFFAVDNDYDCDYTFERHGAKIWYEFAPIPMTGLFDVEVDDIRNMPVPVTSASESYRLTSSYENHFVKYASDIDAKSLAISTHTKAVHITADESQYIFCSASVYLSADYAVDGDNAQVSSQCLIEDNTLYCPLTTRRNQFIKFFAMHADSPTPCEDRDTIIYYSTLPITLETIQNDMINLAESQVLDGHIDYNNLPLFDSSFNFHLQAMNVPSTDEDFPSFIHRTITTTSAEENLARRYPFRFDHDSLSLYVAGDDSFERLPYQFCSVGLYVESTEEFITCTRDDYRRFVCDRPESVLTRERIIYIHVVGIPNEQFCSDVEELRTLFSITLQTRFDGARMQSTVDLYYANIASFVVPAVDSSYERLQPDFSIDDVMILPATAKKVYFAIESCLFTHDNPYCESISCSEHICDTYSSDCCTDSWNAACASWSTAHPDKCSIPRPNVCSFKVHVDKFEGDWEVHDCSPDYADSNIAYSHCPLFSKYRHIVRVEMVAASDDCHDPDAKYYYVELPFDWSSSTGMGQDDNPSSILNEDYDLEFLDVHVEPAVSIEGVISLPLTTYSLETDVIGTPLDTDAVTISFDAEFTQDGVRFEIPHEFYFCAATITSQLLGYTVDCIVGSFNLILCPGFDSNNRDDSYIITLTGVSYEEFCDDFSDNVVHFSSSVRFVFPSHLHYDFAMELFDVNYHALLRSATMIIPIDTEEHIDPDANPVTVPRPTSIITGYPIVDSMNFKLCRVHYADSRCPSDASGIWECHLPLPRSNYLIFEGVSFDYSCSDMFHSPYQIAFVKILFEPSRLNADLLFTFDNIHEVPVVTSSGSIYNDATWDYSSNGNYRIPSSGLTWSGSLDGDGLYKMCSIHMISTTENSLLNVIKASPISFERNDASCNLIGDYRFSCAFDNLDYRYQVDELSNEVMSKLFISAVLKEENCINPLGEYFYVLAPFAIDIPIDTSDNLESRLFGQYRFIVEDLSNNQLTINDKPHLDIDTYTYDATTDNSLYIMADATNELSIRMTNVWSWNYYFCAAHYGIYDNLCEVTPSSVVCKVDEVLPYTGYLTLYGSTTDKDCTSMDIDSPFISQVNIRFQFLLPFHFSLEMVDSGANAVSRADSVDTRTYDAATTIYRYASSVVTISGSRFDGLGLNHTLCSVKINESPCTFQAAGFYFNCPVANLPAGVITFTGITRPGRCRDATPQTTFKSFIAVEREDQLVSQPRQSLTDDYTIQVFTNGNNVLRSWTFDFNDPQYNEPIPLIHHTAKVLTGELTVTGSSTKKLCSAYFGDNRCVVYPFSGRNYFSCELPTTESSTYFALRIVDTYPDRDCTDAFEQFFDGYINFSVVSPPAAMDIGLFNVNVALAENAFVRQLSLSVDLSTVATESVTLPFDASSVSFVDSFSAESTDYIVCNAFWNDGSNMINTCVAMNDQYFCAVSGAADAVQVLSVEVSTVEVADCQVPLAMVRIPFVVQQRPTIIMLTEELIDIAVEVQTTQSTTTVMPLTLDLTVASVDLFWNSRSLLVPTSLDVTSVEYGSLSLTVCGAQASSEAIACMSYGDHLVCELNPSTADTTIVNVVFSASASDSQYECAVIGYQFEYTFNLLSLPAEPVLIPSIFNVNSVVSDVPVTVFVDASFSADISAINILSVSQTAQQSSALALPRSLPITNLRDNIDQVLTVCKVQIISSSLMLPVDCTETESSFICSLTTLSSPSFVSYDLIVLAVDPADVEASGLSTELACLYPPTKLSSSFIYGDTQQLSLEPLIGTFHVYVNTARDNSIDAAHYPVAIDASENRHVDTTVPAPQDFAFDTETIYVSTSLFTQTTVDAFNVKNDVIEYAVCSVNIKNTATNDVVSCGSELVSNVNFVHHVNEYPVNTWINAFVCPLTSTMDIPFDVEQALELTIIVADTDADCMSTNDWSQRRIAHVGIVRAARPSVVAVEEEFTFTAVSEYTVNVFDRSYYDAVATNSQITSMLPYRTTRFMTTNLVSSVSNNQYAVCSIAAAENLACSFDGSIHSCSINDNQAYTLTMKLAPTPVDCLFPTYTYEFTIQRYEPPRKLTNTLALNFFDYNSRWVKTLRTNPEFYESPERIPVPLVIPSDSYSSVIMDQALPSVEATPIRFCYAHIIDQFGNDAYCTVRNHYLTTAEINSQETLTLSVLYCPNLFYVPFQGQWVYVSVYAIDANSSVDCSYGATPISDEMYIANFRITSDLTMLD